MHSFFFKENHAYGNNQVYHTNFGAQNNRRTFTSMHTRTHTHTAYTWIEANVECSHLLNEMQFVQNYRQQLR